MQPPLHPLLKPGRVLKLLRSAGHDATAQELLSTSTWIQVEITEGLLTDLHLLQNTFREGRKVSRKKADRQETAEKQSGLLPVSAILPHNSLMNLLNSLG